MATLALVFILGLMFKATSSLASLFIVVQHNVTIPAAEAGTAQDVVMYTCGLRDLATVFFYVLITVVGHQIIQEYVLDKVNRKLHLSKVKHAKFNESGQLLTFYLISCIWAVDLVIRERIFSSGPGLSLRGLWEPYPANMMFSTKLFFVVQLAYWIHIFPELYFQKVKKEDMPDKIKYASLYMVFIGAAYVCGHTRIALVLLLLQYLTEGLFHACRILSYAEKVEAARPMFHFHEVEFVLARFGSITLAVLTFWHGMGLAPAELQVIDVAKGVYNTFAFRVAALLAVCLLQAWLMFNFVTFHIRRMRESKAMTVSSASTSAAGQAGKPRKTMQEKAKARKEAKKEAEASKGSDGGYEEKDLPEVDQNTKNSLRQRTK